jgi:hypothetical protein
MLDEAILIALGDDTGLSLEPRQLSLIEVHENSHDPAFNEKDQKQTRFRSYISTLEPQH